MAYVDKVTNGPIIRAEDAECLEGFSILRSSGTNTLTAIGYLNKIEGPDNMRKIIERLPPKLQISWRDTADRILHKEEREVCIEDVSLFVEQKSRALNNPIFGKLPCLEKEAGTARKRGLNQTDKSYPLDVRNFSTLSHQNRGMLQKEAMRPLSRRHATVMHAHPVDNQQAVRTGDVSESAANQNRVQCKVEQNNSQARTRDERHRALLWSYSKGGPSALPIVPVKAKSEGVRFVSRPMLLDTGSNSTFCSTSLLDRLGFAWQEDKTEVDNLGQGEILTALLCMI